jgi:hypothetical protein
VDGETDFEGKQSLKPNVPVDMTGTCLAHGDASTEIFISYSHADRAWVWGQLLPRLEGVGLRVVIDDRDFEIGVPSVVNMERAIARCRHTILVLSPAWIASAWTEFESLLVGVADPANRMRTIIPLLLAPCQPPRRIGSLTCADFCDPHNRDAQFARLLAQLGGSRNLFFQTPPRLQDVADKFERAGYKYKWRPLGDDTQPALVGTKSVLVNAVAIVVRDFVALSVAGFADYVEVCKTVPEVSQRRFYHRSLLFYPVAVVDRLEPDLLAYVRGATPARSAAKNFDLLPAIYERASNKLLSFDKRTGGAPGLSYASAAVMQAVVRPAFGIPTF